VEGVRGHSYGKPVTAMREYLERMRAAPFGGQRPAEEPTVLLAALRDRMLALSRDAADGAHPYFVNPEHTQRARAVLGPDKLLAPEQKVLLETNATRARQIARGHMKGYLGLPNYRNSLIALGFEEDELNDGGNDRVVDAVVAWGDESAVRTRIQEHVDAGADHVTIQPLRPDGERGPDMAALEALAPRWDEAASE
jgi:probable F420-dependent oxidoreductase